MRLLLFLSVVGLATPLFGGCGMFMDLGSPLAASDPAAHAAFVTVRIFNCFGAAGMPSIGPRGEKIDQEGAYPRENAVVTVTAEGLVDGRRISLPLRVVKLTIPGLSAVYWEKKPGKGTWVLNFSIAGAGDYWIGDDYQPVLGALAIVGKNGVDRRTQLLWTPPTTEELEKFLWNYSSGQTPREYWDHTELKPATGF